MEWLPLSLKSASQTALVFGLNEKAERKVSVLERCNVRVRRLHVGEERENDQAVIAIPRIENLDQSVFKGVTLAVAASDSRSENEVFAAQARSQGVLVHLSENAEQSDFLFPSVIDRGVITVAVSSAGLQPTLTRLIRSRVESVLPARLGVLAEISSGFREKLKLRYQNVSDRRRFWEKHFEGRFAELIYSGRDDEAKAQLESSLMEGATPSSEVGEVYLVGAGPGDPDLLTFKALRLMRQADVVLYDRLVSPQILAMVRQDADLIDVGKTRSNHTLPQEGINSLLASLALEGKRVLRLKGGDPFIFGRGGEEIETLAEAGVPFQIVPGITAASGCACYSGIPLTHRDYAQSVRFVTGHLKDDSTNLPWKDLVCDQQTLVFYMGLVGLPVIAEQLCLHGMSGDTPVAVISKGTLPEQRVIVSNLFNVAQDVEREKLRAPTIIIVGDVVRLHHILDWKKNKPLL